MQEDDVYINNGEFLGGVPTEPVDQAIDRKKERAETLQVLPVLKDMIKRLDERIEFYQKHSNIPDEVRTDPNKFLIISNSYTMTAETLQSEKEWISGLLDANAKNR